MQVPMTKKTSAQKRGSVSRRSASSRVTLPPDTASCIACGAEETRSRANRIKNTSPEQLATRKFSCGLMLNSRPAKKVATAQPSEPHIRALPNSNWL